MRRLLIATGFAVLAAAANLAAAQEAETAIDDATADSAEVTTDGEVAIDETIDEAPAEDSGTEESAVEEPVETDDVADDTEEAANEADEAVVEEEPATEGTDWAGLIERAPAFLALTHHAAVHLPIALWLFGALFVLVGVVVPSWRNQIPLACLIGGAVTSVAAAASGWWYAEHEYGDEWAWGDMIDRERLAEGIVQHRWIAVALVIASVILSVVALVSQAKKSRRLGFVWRVGLLLLAAVVAYEGHVGGELIMGEGFLEDAFQEWVNPEG
ncbi:MAG: hypothetical protein AAF266_14940 [Planctomycetota bacterium]